MKTHLPLLTFLIFCAGSVGAEEKTYGALQDLRGVSGAGAAVDAMQAGFSALAAMGDMRAGETDRFLERYAKEAAKFQAMKSVHPPVAHNWCALCHTSVEDPTAMREEGNKLCLACHKTKNEALMKSHLGVTTFEGQCIVCHNPHASSAAKLIRSEGQHPAVEDCTACHTGASKDGKPALKSPIASACKECHEESIENALKDPVVHEAFQMGECTVCHNPHFSPRPAFRRAAPQVFCKECHDIPEIGHPVGKHRSFKVGGTASGALPGSFDCTNCHRPHSSKNARLLAAPTGNGLCRTCHKM